MTAPWEVNDEVVAAPRGPAPWEAADKVVPAAPKRMVGTGEVAARAGSGVINNAIAYTQAPIVGGLALADMVSRLFGGSGDLTTRYGDTFVQPAIDAVQNKVLLKPGEDAGPIGGAVIQAAPEFGKMAGDLAQGGPLGSAAKSIIAPVTTAATKAIPAVVNALKQGAVTGIPAGARVAAEKQHALTEAGASPLESVLPAAVSGLSTVGQFALPASAGSSAATLPARIVSRGAQGAALNANAGILQRQAENLALPDSAPSLRVNPTDIGSVIADAVGGAAFGQMGGRPESFNAPNREAFGYRPDPTLAPGATDFVPPAREALPVDPNAAIKAVTDALFAADTAKAPDMTLVPKDAPTPVSAPDPTKAPRVPDLTLEGDPAPAPPKRLTVADQVAQDDLAAATRQRVAAEEAFKLARGVPVDNGKANLVPDSQPVPDTKGGMQERKQNAQDEAAMTGEDRNLSDASAAGSTSPEGTKALAPEEFSFLGVQRDARGNITGTGPQVEVLERMTLQDPKGKPIEAVRVRMPDGGEEVLPANQVTSLSRPANPRFAQDNAAHTQAPNNGKVADLKGLGTGPDQPAPRRAAQRITTDALPEIPGERNARNDSGGNDGAAGSERRPQTYDAEPRGAEASRLDQPAEPAKPAGAEPARPDAQGTRPDGGAERVADPRDVPRLQVEHDKVQTEARKAQTRLNTLLDTQAKGGLDEKRTASLNDQITRTRAKVEELKTRLDDIRAQLTDERIPRKEAGADSILSDFRKEGGLSGGMLRDLKVGASDPKIRAGKLKDEDAVVAAAVKHGWLSYEEGQAPGAYDKVRKMIADEESGAARGEGDLEAQARARENDEIEALAKEHGIDTRDMTKQQKIDAIEKAQEKVLEQQGIDEANEAARMSEGEDARTLDELLNEVGVTDKDIEDAKYAREREAESAAAADEARRARAGVDENPQGGDGEAPRSQDEKRPDAGPGGEQVDGGRGQGDGGSGEARPVAGEAGGESAARSRPDEANYRLNALPFDAAFRYAKKLMGNGKQWEEYIAALRDMTGDLAKQLKKPGEALTALKEKTTTKSGENAAMAVIRWANEDLGRRARIIVDKTGSATARKVLDMMDFELGKGEGTGKVFREAVQQRMGKSLNELAAELEVVNDIAETMRKGGLGRKEAYAKAWEEVIKRVENPSLARQGDIGRAAAKVEAWLKGQRDMQVAAGVDMGDQGARYFPVKYDADKVQADRAAFEADAAASYRAEGATAEEAKAQAKALADGLIRGESFSLVGVETGAAASATKERVFTKPESLNRMRRWRNLDGRDVLISYANSAARRAAIAERFGDNFGGKQDKAGKTITPSWKQLVDKITDEGGADALPILRDLVEIGTGVNQPRGTGANYADAMRNAMTMSALEKSVLPNLMETVTPLATTNGSVAAGLSMLRTNIHGALAGLGVLPKSERRAAAQSLLEGIGALSDIGSQQQAMARYSGSDAGKGGFSEAVGKFFEGIGLNKLTDAQRISTADIGAVWFDSLAKSVTGDGGWKALTKGADAKHLRDMGIPADKVQAFAEYVKSLKGKIPTTAELGKAGEMGTLYGDAITRFMNSTVQHGDALTRPSWASTPWGSLVFQFSSYTYAFHKNVVRRAFNNAMDAGNLKNDLGAADRLSLATGMLPGFMLMGAVSYLTMELRDEVFNEMAGNKKNLTDQAKRERAVQNANLFGKYGRIFEQFGQQRYGTGAAGLFVPPAIAQGARGVDALAQAAREGSDKNTGERKMAKWVYNTILEPAWQIALSAGPGIPFGAASVAARTFAPSAAEAPFVDSVAGPAKKRAEKPIKGVFE